MYKANLSGHSGCVISLMETEAGRLFVRKTAGTTDYNHRLERQCEKQKRFVHSVLRTPKIYEQGYVDGLFYFDMEYVKGITLCEYIKTIEVASLRQVVDVFAYMFTGADADADAATNEVFKAKVLDLEHQIDLTQNSILNEACAKLKNYDWSNFSLSMCHGDLTFENIIVSNDNLYLIDFLDSFYDSVYIDLGKMLQDLIALWSYRKEPEISSNTLIRLKIFKDLLLSKVTAQNGNLVIRNAYYALLLHLVRIVPYIKDQYTYDFVTSKIVLTIDIINKIEDGSK